MDGDARDAVNMIVQIEGLITEAIARENTAAGGVVDPSNVEPGSWVITSAAATTIADGNVVEGLTMLWQVQAMIAEELIGLEVPSPGQEGR